MPLSTAAEFLDALSRYNLLEAEQLADIRGQGRPSLSDLKSLAKELIQRGWLTVWQVNQIVSGRGASLLLDPYLLLDVIGEGGMGHVFKARHRRLDRLAAIKVIHKDRLNNPDAVKRFHREAKAAARLDHSSIVKVFDANEVRGTHFLAMEFVDGKDLSRVVRERGPLPIGEACDYVRQAALGLQHAHEQGLIHRDIKPGNLLLANSGGRPGVVKILDMGLARFTKADSGTELTQEGTVMGSLDYISPEQALDSRQVDIRADLYSLGCTLYFLLTAQVPFPGGEATAKLLKHQMEEPQPIEQLRTELPTAVAGIVRKLMAKKPHDRYQTPAEVAADLAAMEGLAAAAPVARTVQRSARSVESATTVTLQRPAARGRRPLVLGLVASLLLALSLTGWLLTRGKESKGEARVQPPDRPTSALHTEPKRSAVLELQPADPDRRAAEWVLNTRSYIGIEVDGKPVGCQTLAELPKTPFTLVSINVNRNKQVSDETLVVLKGTQHLREAIISNSRATNQALTYLKDNRKLGLLHLHGTQVNDAGMVHVQAFTELKDLRVEKTQVSEAAVKKLAAALPHCRIQWNGGFIEPRTK